MHHDLTFVAPDLRAEVRRRLAAVERFIAAPGRAAAEAAADELGLRPAQFYNLVRAWRETGRAESIVGRNGPRTGRPRIDQAVLDLIEGVIAENGRATATNIIERVQAIAKQSGVTLPDSGTVAKYVRRKRPALLAADIQTQYDLVVDHTVLDLSVDFGDGKVVRPLATLAIDVTTETVVGLVLSPATPSPATTAGAVLDAMRRGIRNGQIVGPRPRIGIVARSPDDVQGVIGTLQRHNLDATARITHRHGGGLIAESVLGRTHAGLQFKQRLVWHEGDRRSAKPASGTAPLTAVEADALTRGRLLDGRSTTVFAGIDDAGRRQLAIELDALLQSA